MYLQPPYICCIRLGIKHRYCRIHQTDSLSLRQFLMDLKFHSVFLLTEKYGNCYIAKPSFILNQRLCLQRVCLQDAIFRRCSQSSSYFRFGNKAMGHFQTI